MNSPIKITRENIDEHLSTTSRDYLPFKILNGALVFRAPDYDLYPEVHFFKDHVLLVMDAGQIEDKYEIEYTELQRILQE